MLILPKNHLTLLLCIEVVHSRLACHSHVCTPTSSSLFMLVECLVSERCALCCLFSDTDSVSSITIAACSSMASAPDQAETPSDKSQKSNHSVSRVTFDLHGSHKIDYSDRSGDEIDDFLEVSSLSSQPSRISADSTTDEATMPRKINLSLQEDKSTAKRYMR